MKQLLVLLLVAAVLGGIAWSFMGADSSGLDAGDPISGDAGAKGADSEDPSRSPDDSGAGDDASIDNASSDDPASRGESGGAGEGQEGEGAAASASIPDTAGLTTGIVVEGRASLGEPAPDFELEALSGEIVSLTDFEGRPVLINFWTTWCAPCRAEMPFLDAVHVKHEDKGLVVLAVDVQEPAVEVEPYIDEYGYRFRVLLDVDGTVALKYRVGSYPTSYLIDSKGRVVNIRRGAFASEADLDQGIRMILPEIGGG